jgi:twitching motility protein PilT
MELLKLAVEKNVSDIFIGAGHRILFKIDGDIVQESDGAITPAESEEMLRDLYAAANKPIDHYIRTGDEDFSVSVSGLARFRVSAYRQRGTMAAVIRVLMFDLPDYKDLHIPEEVMATASEKRGLVLVTGAADSGKTTTLSCLINAVNKTRSCHIITLEDPIEFLHRDDKSVISQREIITDTESYITALRASLRQSPDIILLGEMRDYETIKTAMTAAETGSLVISTLHTVGAVNTLDRIIDVFPPEQQQQIRVQLSMVLRTAVSQLLLPAKAGHQIPAFEIMHCNSAIRSLIRESKTHQIDGVIATSAHEGMISMDSYILKLFADGRVTEATAMGYAVNPEQMRRHIETAKKAG